MFRFGFHTAACLIFLLFGLKSFAQAPIDVPVGDFPKQKPVFKLGLIADAQYCDCDPIKERYFRISEEKLNNAIDTFNARTVDLVVNLGDIIDRDLKSYSTVRKALDRLEMPVYNVLGNHEFWEVPYHSQKTVLDSLNLGHNYCTLDVDGWRLLMLDGTDLAEYAMGAHPETHDEGEISRLDAKGKHNAVLWNGAIGQQQLLWMEQQLAEAAFLGKPVAIFCHFPINPAGHPLTLWNDAVLRDLIAKYSTVEAWFAGHAHEGGYTWQDEIHHVTLQGMLMSPDSNAFAILNFFPDRIEMQGFGREPSRILANKSTQAAIAKTFVHPPQKAPIVLPPPEHPCETLRIKNALGEYIFIGESGGISAADLPKMSAGVYEVRKEIEGKISFEKLVVLPKTKE